MFREWINLPGYDRILRVRRKAVWQRGRADAAVWRKGMGRMKAIGIDIGTTTISVVAIDCENMQMIQRETIANDCWTETANEWERIQDGDRICGKARQLLDLLLHRYPDTGAIGLTGQMHGILYVDGEGRAASPLYTWQDGRGDIPCFEGRSLCAILREDIHVQGASGYGMVTHWYQTRKGLVPKGARSFCTIADYLGMILTQRKLPLLHISQAASLGFYDRRRYGFLSDTAAQLGMDPLLFPEVTDQISVIGTYRGIPVSVSLGDNQASYIGSVKKARETLLINVGTGSQVSLLSENDREAPGVEIRPLTGKYNLVVGAAVCGGAAYGLLEQFFREYAVAAGALDRPQYEVMEAFLREQTETKTGLRVIPTFAGTRTDPQKRGRITGIDRKNFRPANLIRGVLEGMAEELYELYDIARQASGRTGTAIAASGNGVRRNKKLQTILADRFQMPLEVVENEEEAAFGAAVSGLVGTGGISLEERTGI